MTDCFVPDRLADSGGPGYGRFCRMCKAAGGLPVFAREGSVAYEDMAGRQEGIFLRQAGLRDYDSGY